MYATVNTTEPLPLLGGGSPPRQRYSPPAGPSASSSNGQPSLTAPLPTVASLQAALPAIQNPNADPQSKVAWCRDVLQLVNRVTVASNPSPNASASAASGTGTDLPTGPARIADPALARLADIAVPLVIQLSSSPSTSALPARLAKRVGRLQDPRAPPAQRSGSSSSSSTRRRVHLVSKRVEQYPLYTNPPHSSPRPSRLPILHNATTARQPAATRRHPHPSSKYYPPASEPSRWVWR